MRQQVGALNGRVRGDGNKKGSGKLPDPLNWHTVLKLGQTQVTRLESVCTGWPAPV